MNLSVIIPTFNEEKNIKECLESIGDFASEIIIVDMYSTDRTLEIAEKLGAKIFQNKSGEEIQSIQSNVNLGIKKAINEWVMRIDADERLTPDFKKEVESAIKKNIYNAYLISRKQWFINGFLTRGDWAMSRIVRIFKKDCGYYDLKLRVHEKLVVSGRTGKIKSPLIHYSHLDLATVLHRFNQYTDAEGKDKSAQGKGNFLEIIYKPIYVFLRNMTIKTAWCDGTRGMAALLLWCFYQFLSYAKAWEIKNISNQKETLKK